MIYLSNKNAILLLQDGSIYRGVAGGKIGTAIGEICFNTGMTGYQEIFTDPSYFGQVMVATNIHIGNYGIMPIENQSDSIKIAGLVCRTFSNYFSRKLANSSINDYFIAQSITAISNIDTRALISHIRSKGAMNCIISSEDTDIETLKDRLHNEPSMEGRELSSLVATKESYYLGEPTSKHKISVLDLGVKRNILNHLVDRDCYVKVYPAKTTFAEMQNDFQADGYFISNGPGDPATMPYSIQTVKDILSADKPMFGICLGHQMLAQAIGMSTYKMHNGHRGLNHPVKNILTGRSEITSQNHGFAVDASNIDKTKAVVSHINLNDNTIEGIKLLHQKAFSVQYHPEAAPGPHDSHYLFDDFIGML
jgi:carbamoyl-phosphate synthase small subunit